MVLTNHRLLADDLQVRIRLGGCGIYALDSLGSGRPPAWHRRLADARGGQPSLKASSSADMLRIPLHR